MVKTIYFYSRRTAYHEFSNFYVRPITVDGKVWPSTEHYFNAEKFPAEPAYQEQIRRAATCAEAKRLGNSRAHQLVHEWDQVKRFDAMKKALYAKFTQHEDLKKLLLDTGDALLVEDSKNDRFWGCGADRQGQNYLGKMLMELRDELRSSL